MVIQEKIIQKFMQLDEYLKLIDQISKTPGKQFLKDKILIGSAKYYLQVSIECCLDVANHIIASEHYRAPKDYADTFAVIEEEDLIPSELGNRLRQAAKFRNRLVHLYGDIDNSQVYSFINKDIQDLKEFKNIILKHLK